MWRSYSMAAMSFSTVAMRTAQGLRDRGIHQAVALFLRVLDEGARLLRGVSEKKTE